MTNSQIELQKHLTALATKEIESEGTQFVNTDVQYWADLGVNSVEDFERMEAQTYHFDLYKEVHGIRPRWYKYEEMSPEEIWKDIQVLEARQGMENEWTQKIEAEEERLHQERKALNSYKPNLAFEGLRDLLK